MAVNPFTPQRKIRTKNEVSKEAPLACVKALIWRKKKVITELSTRQKNSPFYVHCTICCSCDGLAMTSILQVAFIQGCSNVIPTYTIIRVSIRFGTSWLPTQYFDNKGVSGVRYSFVEKVGLI